MSYLVFSRKFRPELFSEVAGQDHATQTLQRALETGRVGQAYLFSGPRGIGKTTIARILAKSLNCHKGISPVPCNECPSCREISKSSSIDVFEIDGASNRRIEEIRDLRENVRFSPARDRFKIYIIDEVHMLTAEAFNALLKTLEEPPDHVKFIFATTAPEKIPLTIISRCQRFELRKISSREISEKLAYIAKKEKIKAEPDALDTVAGLASGSMRDAQSIFDQISCSAEGKLTKQYVQEILGLIPAETYYELAEAVRESDTLKALEITSAIIDQGKDIEQFIGSWINYWRNILMINAGCEELVEAPEKEMKKLKTQAEGFSRKEILSIISFMYSAGELVKKTASARIPLEIAACELTMLKNPAGEEPVKNPSGKPEKPAPCPEPEKEPARDKNFLPGADSPPGAEFSIDSLAGRWQEVLGSIKKESALVHAYIMEGKPVSVEKDMVKIAFGAKFHRESCDKKENKGIIENVLEKLFSRRLEISCVTDGAGSQRTTAKKDAAGKKIAAAVKNRAMDDPLVKEVSEIFKVDILEIKEEK